MKLARTIRLDVSDTNVFTAAAKPGEWAVTGTFAFADSDPIAWTNTLNGRFFYTELGHDVRSLETPFGRQHIIEAIRWAAKTTE